MTNPLQYGIASGSPSAQRRQMDNDDARFREEQERADMEWRERMSKKVKKTPFGVVNRPPTTRDAESSVDNLGELLGDVADAIRSAQERERVVSSAGAVDRARFPAAGGAR
ncbi:hypothetical protein [Nocardioides sp.]|uniref:hypothetical protein n=1 Tax=Nocardioides sp. TaxID=35761 RepID=UPI0037851CBB